MHSENGKNSNFVVKLRAHHLLAFHSMNGDGYNARFSGRMKWLRDLFYNQPNTIVQIVSTVDSVCDACPHLVNDACCKNNDEQSEKRKQRLDNQVFEVLNISDGRQMTIESAFAIVEDEATPDILHAVSKELEWVEFGALSSAIRKGFW